MKSIKTIIAATLLAGITIGSVFYCKPSEKCLTAKLKLEDIGFQFDSKPSNLYLTTGMSYVISHEDKEFRDDLISRFDRYSCKEEIFEGKGFQFELSGKQFYYTDSSDKYAGRNGGIEIVVVNDKGEQTVIRKHFEYWLRCFPTSPGLYRRIEYQHHLGYIEGQNNK